MRFLVLCFVVLALPACDPIFGVYARQTLSPAPERACILAVLDSSEHVMEWGPRDDPQAAWLRVFYGDTLNRRSRRMAYLGIAEPSDSGRVVSVEVETIHGPTHAHRLEIVRFAGAFLPEVRRACAPHSPAPPTCEYTGWGGRKSCALTDPAHPPGAGP
jgi:hypothetical protein